MPYCIFYFTYVWEYTEHFLPFGSYETRPKVNPTDRKKTLTFLIKKVISSVSKAGGMAFISIIQSQGLSQLREILKYNFHKLEEVVTTHTVASKTKDKWTKGCQRLLLGQRNFTILRNA